MRGVETVGVLLGATETRSRNRGCHAEPTRPAVNVLLTRSPVAGLGRLSCGRLTRSTGSSVDAGLGPALLAELFVQDRPGAKPFADGARGSVSLPEQVSWQPRTLTTSAEREATRAGGGGAPGNEYGRVSRT